MPSQVFDNTEKRTETRICYVFWTSKFFGPSAVPTPYYNSSTFGLATSWKKRFRLTNQRSSYYSQKNTNVCFYRPLFPPTMYHNSAQCQRQPHMYFLVVMKIKRTSFKIDMSRPQFIQNTCLVVSIFFGKCNQITTSKSHQIENKSHLFLFLFNLNTKCNERHIQGVSYWNGRN